MAQLATTVYSFGVASKGYYKESYNNVHTDSYLKDYVLKIQYLKWLYAISSLMLVSLSSKRRLSVRSRSGASTRMCL